MVDRTFFCRFLVTGTGTLPAPTLALHVDSDTGTVGDNTTSDTTPKLTITPGTMLEGDHLMLRAGTALNVDHIVTAPEAGGAEIEIVAAALPIGVHPLQARRISGALFSDWGTVLSLTIVAPEGTTDDTSYVGTYVSSGAV